MDNFKDKLENYINSVDKSLLNYLPSGDVPQKEVFEAMKYSVMAGGKRIRPILTLEFCKLCGGKVEEAMPFACACEFIHSYSLIHDDLPCMDDDNLRRGKPSCHIKYGEATALLAGDALLSLAFETALCNNNIVGVNPKNVIKAMHELARASGSFGMVGGQVVDLDSEGKDISIERLHYMDENKTGAMITAACKMGCIIADASEEKIKFAEEYSKLIGLSFQIVDDILDVEADEKELGKPIGSDKVQNKTNYITYYGLNKSKEIVGEMTSKALNILDNFEQNDFLKQLTVKLSNRNK